MMGRRPQTSVLVVSSLCFLARQPEPVPMEVLRIEAKAMALDACLPYEEPPIRQQPEYHRKPQRRTNRMPKPPRR